ncbi:MAG: GyrI-like domain-containing protein [Clostridiales bacterium]|jgi:predicted transcriptional regulator YdeE|nr:GyrI-like domain-containing protein [Clostridiales bacterium]
MGNFEKIKEAYGITPRDYRKYGYQPVIVTVEEMIMKFTNRLRGGIYLNPKIINREAMIIAGISGDGNKTWDVWNRFETLSKEKPLNNKLSENGYEIRLYDGEKNIVHVGFSVSGEDTAGCYELFKLPAAKYACFDVYVEKGYESENDAMNEWLETNSEGYSERLLGKNHYCVEYYDERFNGSEAGSIVEIWVPVEKK